MMYHRFGELYTMADRPHGTDMSRQRTIAHKDIHFKLFEEAYCSRNWIVRIYRVLPRQNRAKPFENIPDRSLVDPEVGDNLFVFEGTEEKGGPNYYAFEPDL